MDYFPNAYIPAMDYFNNPHIFTEQYLYLKDFAESKKLKLLIGSSMGGYFAYYLGKKLNIPTLLFNPALPYRSFEPKDVDKTGNYYPFNNIVIGINDDIIIPKDTVKWLKEYEYAKNYQIFYEEMGHRTPIDVFKKYVFKFC